MAFAVMAAAAGVCLTLGPVRAQVAATAGATLSASTPPASSSATAASGASAMASVPSPGVKASTSAPPHTVAYTVVKGDSLTRLAAKFNTTRKKLRDLNDLAGYKLTPGEVIYVPGPAKKPALASAVKAKHHAVAPAPVEDYDVPASNFASCPVTPSNADDDSDLVATYGKAPPVAPLVSPSEMQAEQEKQPQQAADEAAQVRLAPMLAPARLALPPEPGVTSTGTLTPLKKKKLKAVTSTAVAVAPVPAKIAPAPTGWAAESNHFSASASSRPQPSAMARLWNSLTGSRSGNGATMDSPAYDPSNAWGYKFLEEARALGDRGIDYDDDWRPPGEASPWVMDCSNTSRWLYKSVAGINLPRTASDQYYYLHLQGKAWDVPRTDYGMPDMAYLQHNLKPGDLLFWENTYKPERQPPITHVMVFLGTNERGQWIMAGSQSSRGGEHNRRDGGPDVYVFRPSQPCGGWSSWFGLGRHVGRFCAFGRPLEADPSKLAAND